MPVATHSILPNDFVRLDLHQATTIWPSAARAFKWRLPANTQAGSSFPSPHAHPMFPAGALIVWQLPLRPRLGHAKDVKDGPPKSSRFREVRRSGTGAAVRRRSTVATRRQDRFNPQMDVPKLRGCTFDGMDCLLSSWLLWAVWRRRRVQSEAPQGALVRDFSPTSFTSSTSTIIINQGQLFTASEGA